MLKRALTAIAILPAALFFGCDSPADPAAADDAYTPYALTAGTATKLSGTHYSLNLIGVSKGKTADMTGDNGHRIFVNLFGKTQILLSEGDFQVLDANGTDGSAKFQLPSPDPANSGVTTYSVWARALGKPGGKASMLTAATDPATGETVYSLETTVLVRGTGKSAFSDISKSLLYVYADLDGDGTAERYPLFDSALQDYFWQYDNNGLKLVQLRFYPISSGVNATSGAN